VAFEVAGALGAPLDLFIVRKIGAPWNDEVAIGAIASGGIVQLDRSMLERFSIDARVVDRIIEREARELSRRERVYRGARPFPDLAGRTVILVDDGLATGASMAVAVEAIRDRKPAQLIVAAPVASHDACDLLASLADRCVCVATPEPFYGVGRWYDEFDQTTDAEVVNLLASAARRFAAAS
jgi:predicted phosphoribosyltransferase